MSVPVYNPEGFALQIFQDRYAIHAEETFGQACERVARSIADAEMGTKRDEYFARFLEILQTNRFSPGGRIWRGAGRPRGQMLNCFCIPAEDSREGWGDVLRNVTIISGTGGGVGINFCMGPKTKILTQDFRWIPLEQVCIGDKIIGFDEEYNNACRHLRPSNVLSVDKVFLPTYKIKTEKGEMIVSSTHPILARAIRKNYKRKGYGFGWVQAQHLTTNHELAYACDPWSIDFRNQQFCAWMGGMLDGEGCLSRPSSTKDRKYNTRLSIGQNKGPVFDEIGRIFDILGINYKIYKNSGNKCHQYVMSSKWDSMKVIASCPTIRMWANRNSIWDGAKIHSKSNRHIKIDSIEYIGPQELIAISTSTHTFIGDGFFQHNSRIRPRGTAIRGTGGEATGAVSLMRVVNAVCNELREGGGRRGALLFCLYWKHPDLLEFLEAKLDKKELTNANISVLIDNEFLKLVDEDGEIIFKWQGEERGHISAKKVWDKIIQNAWEGGDPGFLNAQLINDQNTIAYTKGGEFSATNPCGEIPLEEFGCCCLGAINLHTHIIDGKIDWDLLEETTAMGVRFLDNVLDQNNYPLPIIEETAQKHRRIGLGVMGLHDMLLELGLKYSSEEARETVDKVMDFVKKQAYHASITLAIEKGPFHAFDVDQHIKTGFIKKYLPRRHHRLIREHGIRNCALLTIAPTGTISIVADCSSGIEPLFQPVYERRFNKHKDMHRNEERDRAVEVVVHPLLRRFLEAKRSVKHFQGAHDIEPGAHLAMQMVCQRHIDNSISKTINLPTDYSVDQLSREMRQYIAELKGITVYRDGSKGESPLIPLPLSEAKQHLGQMEEEAAVNDCPSGVCEITKGGS